MRKVKFTQDSFDEKLGAILSEFPLLDVSNEQLVHPPNLISILSGPSPIPFLAYERAL